MAVDEFAKLREEIPSFVDGVVDVAQRGRSLGVHMVLASQLLGNAFTNAIRGNTNLRLALRAADDAQSEEAIGARDAARIPSGPAGLGRGFARIGQGRLTEFQTAYVSGRSRAGATSTVVADRYELVDADRDEFHAGDSDTEESDLTVLAEAARGACERLGLVPPPPPWLPPLPEELALAGVPRVGGDGCVAIGMVDEPARQLQRPLVIDFERAGFTVVFGSGGSGRTTVLRTLAAALAAESAPEDLHLYALDGGSRGLAGLTNLPHCAAVVTPDEEERVDRMLGRLERLVERRGREFADLGATNLPERLRRRPDVPCPRIVLLIDDLGELLRTIDTAAGMQQMTRLTRLVSAGRQLGLGVVATASGRSAVGSTLLPHVARRIVLGMGTAEDALALGVERDAAEGLDGTPGRGIVDGDLLVQIAHIGASAAGEDQLAALEELRGGDGDARPLAVRTLPEEVSLDRLPAPSGGLAVPVGIGGLELETIVLDLTDRHLLVSGGRRSGRSTLLATLARGLGAEAEVRVLTPKRSQPLAGLGAVSGPPECAAALSALAVELESRLAGGGEHAPLVVVVDDAGELADAASAMAAERLARRGLEVAIHLVVAADKGTARGFTHPWVRQLANDGHGVVLAPEDATQADHLGAQLPRRSSAPTRPGRGYLVRDGEATLVQTAR